jgi:Sulfotransferase domain
MTTTGTKTKREIIEEAKAFPQGRQLCSAVVATALSRRDWKQAPRQSAAATAVVESLRTRQLLMRASNAMPQLPQRKLDFIIPGAQKAGTTALHYFLQKHPQITLGDQQEMHFFDNDDFFAREPIDYEQLHRHFPPLTRAGIAGECTPHYLHYTPAIERIWNYNPKIKLLILLRNPLDRAFAHWNMQRFKGREPLDFLDAVKNENPRLAGGSPLEKRRFSYITRGFYGEQLQRVLKFFPREQVKLIKFEQFRDNNCGTLNSVFEFLGLKPPRHIRTTDRNVVPYKREMTIDERKYLYAILSDEIVRIEQMLGWDCSDWKS